MASSNIHIAASHRANARTSDSTLFHHSRTVYVGKEKYPINLNPLVHESEATWRKQRRFHQLESAVVSLRDTHQVADLIELVKQEVSINVDSAAKDAMNKRKKVLTSVTRAQNLNVSAFLNETGKQVNLMTNKLEKRPEEITFFHFSFNLNHLSINVRIKQKPMFFSFCIRLPQHR